MTVVLTAVRMISYLSRFEEEYADEKIREFEDHRREFISILKELRQKHPNLDMLTLEAMAREEVLNKGPKSRAYYRIQATRKLTGGGNLAKKTHDLLQAEVESEKKQEEQESKSKDPNEPSLVYFDPGHYTVMESVGSFTVTVSRDGGDLGLTLMVDYQTEDGTANAGGDYEPVE
jgi:solute carrier family 8 (sodium/calcium exchanger)